MQSVQLHRSGDGRHFWWKIKAGCVQEERKKITFCQTVQETDRWSRNVAFKLNAIYALAHTCVFPDFGVVLSTWCTQTDMQGGGGFICSACPPGPPKKTTSLLPLNAAKRTCRWRLTSDFQSNSGSLTKLTMALTARLTHSGWSVFI